MTAGPERVGAIRQLAEGAIADWLGLPEGCRHEDFAAVLIGGDEPGKGLLSGYRTDFRYYRSEHQDQPLRVWFDDEGSAILVILVSPKLTTEVPALLEELGQPERRLNALIGFDPDAYQWIYASRGLTLFVREHVDEIARLAAYVSTSAGHYESSLGAHDQPNYSA